ncbi:hypothetical protein Csa_019397 [Cucumis sativus]|nr:hypothetical protein Csa_019397 [Cucumis sativus]
MALKFIVGWAQVKLGPEQNSFMDPKLVNGAVSFRGRIKLTDEVEELENLLHRGRRQWRT